MNDIEKNIVIITANKIKNNESITHKPIERIIGKSYKDLFEAGYIYHQILSV